MKLAAIKQSAKLFTVVAFFGLYSVGLVVVGIEYGKNTLNSNSEEQDTETSGALMRPQVQEEVQSAEVLASNVKLCANTAASFEITYPNEWFTTYNNKEEECMHFAPYSFVLPGAPDDYFSPITVKIIPKDEWEATVDAQKNPTDIFSVINFKNLEFDSKPAKYIEAISTGSSVQKGFYKITYLIFNSEAPLEITYLQQTQDDDTSSYRKALEDMAKSVRYF